MGRHNPTHYEGQRRFECECGRTVRLKPKRIEMKSDVVCGKCGKHTPREEVERQVDEVKDNN